MGTSLMVIAIKRIAMNERTSNVFTALCRHCVSIMDGWVPYPAWAIAQSCGLTLYQTRKELHRLRDMGLCAVDTMILDREDYMLPYHGWQITKEARATPQYQEAELQEAELCAQCFGGTVESYLKGWEILQKGELLWE